MKQLCYYAGDKACIRCIGCTKEYDPGSDDCKRCPKRDCVVGCKYRDGDVL